MDEAHKPEDWDKLRGKIPEGTLKDRNGVPVSVNGKVVEGILVCNVPVESKEYVVEYLIQRFLKVKRGFEKVAAQLDPGKWSHPEIPVRQILRVLVLACFQFQGDYWLRHARTD